jgi:uncharacterized damage-inducible protein DinB
MSNFRLEEALALLARTPETLRTLLAGLDPAWTAVDEGPATWSPYVVVGHLVHGEKTDWIPRARLVLEQGADRRFAPFDRFAQLRPESKPALAEALDEFARLRAESLRFLRAQNLGERELSLCGEHPAFGAVTLRQLLATWVAHDLGHLAQIARVMAKRYRDDVGPWRAYLPILDR